MHFFETATILPMYLNYGQDFGHMEIDGRFAFIHKCQFSALPLANMAVSKNGDLYTLSAQFCILFLTKETTVGTGGRRKLAAPLLNHGWCFLWAH